MTIVSTATSFAWRVEAAADKPDPAGGTWRSMMNVRLFDWRDLPVLHRYRRRCLFLDSALLLTRGMLASTGAWLSSLGAAAGVYTFIGLDEDANAAARVSQTTYTSGSPSARLVFLAPQEAIEPAGMAALLDYMAVAMGELGALHILAEVDEEHPAFEVLHLAGYAVYARQRIWRLTGEPLGEPAAAHWRACTERDLFSVRTLYTDLVPGLVQQTEPPPTGRLRGLVTEGEDVLAYVELHLGPQGIWMQPFIHPDTENVAARLLSLLKNFPGRRTRPIYLCVRSYQSWLEAALEELGAEAGPRQAVMVKRLALTRRAAQPYAVPALNGKSPEPTVPLAPVEKS